MVGKDNKWSRMVGCGMFGVRALEAGSLSSQPQGEQRETNNASRDR